METIFNILDFGAVGDGKTDCTAAIQSALDKASGGMGKVIVPPGVYLSGQLHMHGRSVSIVGSGAWAFRSEGACVIKLNDKNATSLLDITGAFGAYISGIDFFGNYIGNDTHGIYLYWPEYNGGSEEDTPTVDNCRISSFSGDGIHFEHVWCFSLRHSMLYNNLGAGLYIDGWDAFILDNWFTANKKGGILGGPITNSITCTGNRVEWNNNGGFVLTNGDSYNITGNFFDRTFGPALDLGRANTEIKLASICGNIFRRSDAYNSDSPFEDETMSSHIRLKNCSNISLTGNTMSAGKDDGGGGILTPVNAIIIDTCTGLIVKDNSMCTGAVKNLIIENNNKDCIMKDNIGSTT